VIARSGDQLVERFTHRADGRDLAAGGNISGRGITFRDHTPVVAHLCSFAHTQRSMRSPANLAGESNFSKHGRSRPDRAIPYALGNRCENRQVCRGLVHAHPARDVHEHVVGNEVEPGALVEHGEQQ
jgi:hypothetical protein